MRLDLSAVEVARVEHVVSAALTVNTAGAGFCEITGEAARFLAANKARA